MIAYKRILLLALIFASVLAGCEDSWEEHTKVSDPALKEGVLEQISGKPELSRFYGFVKETGYDSLLRSSKAFTVWAPTNEALQSLDQELINDPVKLKRFVANHINYQQYYTHSTLADSTRLQTISGKYIVWGDVTTQINADMADLLAANGVVHLLNEPLTPKANSWEFLLESGWGEKQAAFSKSLEGEIFVDSIAPKIGVDPLSGEPVYDTLAGMVPYNPFFARAYDISDEDSLNTFIILTDEAFGTEVEELRRFFNTGKEDSTMYYTSLAIVKDLAFKGMYTPEKLPPVLYSRDSVKVTIDQSAIVHVEETSNGIVYVVDNINITPQEKLKPIKVQGEWAYRFRQLLASHPEQARTIGWRTRTNPVTNEIFQDITAYGHGIAGFNIRYPLEEVYSTTFDVYMTTYNDQSFNGGTEFMQKIAFKDPAATELGYKTVPAGSYNRILVGRYTVDQFGKIDMYLVSDMQTRNSQNPLLLDYVELVPVVQ